MSEGRQIYYMFKFLKLNWNVVCLYSLWSEEVSLSYLYIDIIFSIFPIKIKSVHNTIYVNHVT